MNIAYCVRGRGGARPSDVQTGHRHAVQMEPLESRWLLAGEPLMITEFMASDGATLKDRFREYSDWVEIYNPTDQAVELGGWRLTDDAADLSKWQFPAASVAAWRLPGRFASGRNQVEVGKELTPTSSSRPMASTWRGATDGTVAHAYARSTRSNTPMWSYGLAFDDLGPLTRQVLVFCPRSAGQRNGPFMASGRSAEVAASVQLGFFEESLWCRSHDQQPQVHDPLHDRRDRSHAGTRRNLHAADHDRDDHHAAGSVLRGRTAAQRDLRHRATSFSPTCSSKKRMARDCLRCGACTRRSDSAGPRGPCARPTTRWIQMS